VLAGDFDGDGRNDLAVLHAAGVSIRRGNGNGTFVDGVTLGDTPAGMAAGDFDRDGDLDFAVTVNGSDHVVVTPGNGDATFGNGMAYGTGTTPRGIIAADVDRDGRLDLVIANSGSNDVSILRGNGDGTFQVPGAFDAGTNPVAVTAADFDRDGKLDLAVANRGSNTVSILPGNGDGTFDDGPQLSIGNLPVALAAADLDRDGDLDLVIANSGSNDVSVMPGNGDGTFQPPAFLVVGVAPSGLALADFEGDGDLDLAVANEESDDVKLFLNHGGALVALDGTIATGDGASAVIAADFNGDGKPELAVANGGAGSVSMLLNTCPRADLTIAKTHAGNFTQGSTGQTYTIVVRNIGFGATKGAVTVVDTLPAGLRAAAMSGSGWNCNLTTLSCTRADVLFGGNSAYPPITLTVAVALNAPSTVVNRAVVSGGGDNTTNNNTADDATIVIGVTDLTVALTHSGSFVQGATGRTYSIVVRNAGGLATSGAVTVQQMLPASLTATAMSGTGWMCTPGSVSCSRSDVLGGNSSYPPITVTVNIAANAPSEVVSTATVSGGNQSNSGNDTATDRTMIWSSASCGAFGAPVTYAGGSTVTGLTMGDFTGDGRPDLAVANYYSHTVSVLAGTGDGTFAPAVSSPSGGQYPRGIVAGDLDLDGKLDVVVASENANSLSVLLGNGNGTFAAPAVYAAGSLPRSPAIADLNADGLPDLAVTNVQSSQISVFLGNGGGTFHPRAIVTTGGTAALTGIAVADLNSDGVPDLAAASEYGGVWRLLGNGDGSFGTGVQSPAGNSPRHVAAADLNRDGRSDLIVANYYDGTVVVLLGAGDGSFAAPVTYQTGYATALTQVIDLNGDGALDVLASSTYDGISLLRGNGDGTLQEATYIANVVGPLAVSDFNGDGRPDLAATGDWDGVSVLLGGCADLTVTKTHTGNFKAGGTHTYAITVSNVGSGSVQGVVTMTENLPAGLTITSLGGSYPWQCTLAGTCTTSDVRPPNTSYPPIYVHVSVARTAPASVTNSVTVSGGGDANPANNSASDPTTIEHAADLKLTMSHVGNFAQGQTGAVYTINVGNIGSGPTNGAVTVSDHLPFGLTVTGMSGNGWSCNTGNASCTRQDALAIDATWPPITVVVSVAANAPSSLRNAASVSGGGDAFPDNNYQNDQTNIVTTPINVAATPLSMTQISVTWNAVPFALSYRVLRSANVNGPFVQVGAPLSNSFLDSSLAQGTTYYYRIQAADQTVVTLQSATVSATTTAPVVPGRLGDINGDVRSDITWYAQNGQTAYWLMDGPNKTLGFLGDTFTTPPLRPVGMGDFNGDKRADILFRYETTGEYAIWFLDGQSKLAQHVAGSAAPEWNVAAIADFDGDGRADLFLRNATTSSTRVWLMQGAERKSNVVLEDVPHTWTLAGAGDFDGDGKADLFWRHEGGSNAIWLMNGASKKAGAYAETSPVGWAAVGVGDFDGDGKADVFWRHTEGHNAVWLMDGATKKTGAWLEPAEVGWYAAQIGDFDGDRKADVLWRHTDGYNAMWLMDGTTKKLGTWLEWASSIWFIIK
jgi:uncharacterized repeat protein (TIGR01451 family)